MSTCSSCKYIGPIYWGDHNDLGGKVHRCEKSAERRRDAIRPTGDPTEDVMANFCAFFDARATQKACRHHEERHIVGDKQMLILQIMANATGKAAFGFLGESNALCEQMSGTFVERDDHAPQRMPADGTRDWRLTKLGEAEAARAATAREG